MTRIDQEWSSKPLIPGFGRGRQDSAHSWTALSNMVRLGFYVVLFNKAAVLSKLNSLALSLTRDMCYMHLRIGIGRQSHRPRFQQIKYMSLGYNHQKLTQYGILQNPAVCQY